MVKHSTVLLFGVASDSFFCLTHLPSFDANLLNEEKGEQWCEGERHSNDSRKRGIGTASDLLSIFVFIHPT